MNTKQRWLGWIINSLLALPLMGQVVVTYEFAGINKPIVDYPGTGLVDVQTINDDLKIMDVNVKVTIREDTWDSLFNGDYYAYLSHENTQAILLNRVGRRVDVPGEENELVGYGDNGFQLTLDDQAVNGDIHQYRETMDFGNHGRAGTRNVGGSKRTGFIGLSALAEKRANQKVA